MNKEDLQKGFMTLTPLLIMLTFLSVIMYIGHFRTQAIEYSLSSHQSFLEKQNAYQTCLNLHALYQSYDPDFLMNC